MQTEDRAEIESCADAPDFPIVYTVQQYSEHGSVCYQAGRHDGFCEGFEEGQATNSWVDRSYELKVIATRISNVLITSLGTAIVLVMGMKILTFTMSIDSRTLRPKSAVVELPEPRPSIENFDQKR